MRRPLKIAQIAFGLVPIPPPGWGAVESIVWEYAQRLRARGHRFEIVNQRKRQALRTCLTLGGFDYFHCHNERALSRILIGGLIRRTKVVATSHHAFPMNGWNPVAEDLLVKLSRARYHLPITPLCADLIRKRKPTAQIAVMPNGCEVKEFRLGPQGNGRAVCIGRVEHRKRQGVVATQLLESNIPIDFVGPIKDSILPEGASYVGEWTRDELRDRLTSYSTLVLFSEAEGHPLVVAEALAAGLSVVVSPAGAVHLDPGLPFVKVCEQPDQLAEATSTCIQENERYRSEIRALALEQFDWDQIVTRYEEQLYRWLDERP